ncbi:MAG TPA: hypothetical protein EYH01_10720 [Campylobacterales bacterium]|nr:hypothetical protein [Campylobacterales bacterium]HIP60885.1 hypothetical protein [Campylobacterales bacterium]
MKIVSTILSVLVLNSTLFADDMAEKIQIQNQEIVKLAAEELTSQLPQKIDDYTQLVKIEGKKQSLVYTYEINTGAKSDDTVINEDKSRMKKAVTKGICDSSERFLTSGIDISYIYASAKSKKELFRFDVSREDCVKK